MNLRIAISQINIQFEQAQNYRSHLHQYCEDAANNHSQLLMLPELWVHGYHKQIILNDPNYHLAAVLPEVQAAAFKHHVSIAGTYVEEDNGKRFNTLVLVNDEGKIIARYRKTHLFSPLHEDRYFSVGDDIVVIDTHWGKLGLAICYDLRFPELFRSMSSRGAEGILICSEWPASRMMHWETLTRARAIENQCWVACANCTGKTGLHEFGGMSKLIYPDGTESTSDAQPGIFFFDVDTSSTKKQREVFPIFKDIRKDLF